MGDLTTPTLIERGLSESRAVLYFGLPFLGTPGLTSRVLNRWRVVRRRLGRDLDSTKGRSGSPILDPRLDDEDRPNSSGSGWGSGVLQVDRPRSTHFDTESDLCLGVPEDPYRSEGVRWCTSLTLPITTDQGRGSESVGPVGPNETTKYPSDRGVGTVLGCSLRP